MPTQKKIDAVAKLRGYVERATLIVSAEYRGLTVREMQDLRRKLREGGVEVKVIKNTLLRLAAQQAGQPDLINIIEGPTALAMSYGDIIEAAKAVTAYAQTAPQPFSLRGAFVEGQTLSANQLRDLVKIPPKSVLLAQLLGQLQSPLVSFVTLLESPLRELTLLLQALLSELPGLVEARARQLEAQG